MRNGKVWLVCSLCTAWIAAAAVAAPPAAVQDANADGADGVRVSIDADRDGMIDSLDPLAGRPAVTPVPPPGVSAQDMIGVAFFGDTFTVDSGTGVGAALGPSGKTRLNSMARTAGGVFYTVGGPNNNTLISIDPDTGAGTDVVNINTSDIRGLAIDGAGVFYGIKDNGLGVIDDLYRLDVGGGAFLVGPTGFPGLQGLAIAPDGRAYGWDVGPGNGIGVGLVTINLNTGAGADVNPNVGNTNDIQTLSFNSNGTLYGARNSLYTIDRNSGAQVLVGAGGYSDLRGMEFTAGGQKNCEYTLSKSKAKGGCGTCPRRGTTIQTQQACENVEDCRKKLKTTINCPEGQGTCKLKGKATGCR